MLHVCVKSEKLGCKRILSVQVESHGCSLHLTSDAQ